MTSIETRASLRVLFKEADDINEKMPNNLKAAKKLRIEVRSEKDPKIHKAMWDEIRWAEAKMKRLKDRLKQLSMNNIARETGLVFNTVYREKKFYDTGEYNL